MNATDVNLYLVGFMGTGKSTVGRAVAHKLGFHMVDSDHEIERLQRKTIPDIFAQDGEPAFRAMERAFMMPLLAGMQARRTSGRFTQSLNGLTQSGTARSVTGSGGVTAESALLAVTLTVAPLESTTAMAEPAEH